MLPVTMKEAKPLCVALMAVSLLLLPGCSEQSPGSPRLFSRLVGIKCEDLIIHKYHERSGRESRGFYFVTANEACFEQLRSKHGLRLIEPHSADYRTIRAYVERTTRQLTVPPATLSSFDRLFLTKSSADQRRLYVLAGGTNLLILSEGY